MKLSIKELRNLIVEEIKKENHISKVPDDLFTIEDFEEMVKKDPKGVQDRNKTKYWKKNRLSYHLTVRDMVEKMNNVNKVLEIGSNGFPIVKSCLKMGLQRSVDDIVHNAGDIPWPFKDNEFDLAVGLQIWEHLDGTQAEAFKELMRVTKSAILSFPYLWDGVPSDNLHYMIDKDTIDEWTCHQEPVEKKIDECNKGFKRLIYQWKF